MPYRVVASPKLALEDLDTPEIVEAVLAVEGDDADVRMLAELAEMGMDLAKAQRAYAKTRLAAVAADGKALNPGEEPTGAFNKLAQTVRRTVALKKQLAEEVKTRRAGLLAERAARRATRTKEHAGAVRHEIENALVDAFEADLILPDLDPAADPCKPEPYEIERREMLDDAEMLLEDFEAFHDHLTRPVGETVAMLCSALGMDPGSCVKKDGAWRVRRSNTAFENMREKKRASLPPLHGEGQTAKRPGWGTLDETHSGVESTTPPHPVCSANGPCP